MTGKAIFDAALKAVEKKFPKAEGNTKRDLVQTYIDGYIKGSTLQWTPVSETIVSDMTDVADRLPALLFDENGEKAVLVRTRSALLEALASGVYTYMAAVDPPQI